MPVTAGLLLLNLGLLAQAMVPEQKGSADVTGKIRHVTQVSTSASACPGKSQKP